MVEVTQPIKPTSALYIKFGQGGMHARECFEKGILLFGYSETPYEVCMSGDWDEVSRRLIRLRGSGKKGVATADLGQVKNFYTAGCDVLWVTIHDDCLYWCFSEPSVRLYHPEGDGDTRDRYVSRPALGGWSKSDIKGEPLYLHRISSLITKTHGYMRTICGFEGSTALDYLVHKINADERANLREARLAREKMVDRMGSLIGDLSQGDFELLIDLLFRQAGWQRLGAVGGVQKTLDIALLAPITGDQYGVQVKVTASSTVYNEWTRACDAMTGYSAFYFAVQKPVGVLADKDSGKYRVLGPKRVAELTVDYGLVGWVLEKAA